MTTSLRYIGPHDAVAIATPAGEVEVARDGSFEVEDELAKRLLEQTSNYEPAAKTAGKKG